MSKQSEAKARQGYNGFPRNCGNCMSYDSDVTKHKGVYGGDYVTEKHRVCRVGGFAVKKSAVCNEWAKK